MYNMMQTNTIQFTYSNYIKSAFVFAASISLIAASKVSGILFDESQYGSDSNENEISSDFNSDTQMHSEKRSINQASILPINNTTTLLALVEGIQVGSFNLGVNVNIQGMVIKNTTAYIAAGDDGMLIIDINIPNSPKLLGRYSSPAFVNDIDIEGNYAFLARSEAGMGIVNISDPQNVTIVGGYMFGEFNFVNPVTHVKVTNNKVFINNAEIGAFHVIDAAQPSQVAKGWVIDAMLDFAMAVEVNGHIAYVADGSSGLQIINVEDPAYPQIIGSYNTPASENVAFYADAVYLSSGNFGLQIINVQDPTSPQLLGSYSGGRIGSVVKNDNIAYVVNWPSEMQILDVSNPASVQKLGNYTTPGRLNDIALKNDIAYLADGNSGIHIIDVNNSSSPSWLSTYDTSGYANKVIVDDNIIYVADDYEGGMQIINVNSSTTPNLLGSILEMGLAFDIALSNQIAYIALEILGVKAIDVSNPLSPQIIGHLTTPSNAFGVIVSDDIIYIANDTAGLQIISVSLFYDGLISVSEEAATVAVIAHNNYFLYSSFQLGLVLIKASDPISVRVTTHSVANAVAVNGDLAYVAIGSTDLTSQTSFGLQIIDVRNYTSPQTVGSYGTPDMASKVIISGNIAYVLDVLAGLLIIDVSNPGNPQLLGEFTIGSVRSLSVVNNLAYILNSSSVQIIEVLDKQNPKLLGSYIRGGTSISVDNNLAYIAQGTSGIVVVDVSDPTRIQALGRYGDGNGFQYFFSDIFIDRNLGYLAVNERGAVNKVGFLQILDVSDTASFQLLGSFDTLSAANSLTYSNQTVYLANGAMGLQIIDVNDVTHPKPLLRYNTIGVAKSVVVQNQKAYVADDIGGLQIIDLDWQKNRFSTAQTTTQIVAQNNTVYLSDTSKNLYVLDIIDVSNPTEISQYNLAFHATDMAVENNYLYVAQGIDGIEIIDVSDNTKPVFAGRITQGINNARSVKVEGNRLYIIDENKQVVVYDIQTLSYLTLINNQFTISEDERHVISTSELNTLAINVNNGNAGVTYTIHAIQHGQFELVNNVGIAITQFTQQQIDTGQVIFVHDGSEAAPRFDITVSDGIITDGPYTANINYTPVNDVPSIVNNQLSVNEGASVIISANNLSANDIDNNNNSLEFIVNTIANSQFSLVSEPGVIITRFTQGNVTLGQVQFRHVSDFTANPENLIPSYQIAVSDGLAESNFITSQINFNAAPRLITNQLNIHKGDSITLNEENLQATDLNNDAGSLMFVVNEVQHGQFELSSQPGVSQTNFTQQQVIDGEVRFSHDNSNSAPSYQVSVRDNLMQAGNATADITFNTQDNDNTGLIAGATVGGVLGLTALLIGAGYFAKNQRDANSRQHHLLADRVRTHLKLTEVDNFKTEKGRKYCRIVEQDIANQLTSHGVHLNTMSDRAIDDLAKQISYAAKNKITGSATFLGKSKITVDELERKASVIADAVAQQRSNPELYASNRELEKDENTIELGNFIPKFSFGSNQYESV